MEASKRLAALLALAGVAALGCGDSTSPQTVVGVYALQTINASAPPVVIAQDASGSLSVIGGEITLNADQTFTDRTDYVFVAAGSGDIAPSQDVTTGTYSRSGNTITLAPAFDTPYSLTWDGNTLTQVESAFTVVYRK